MTGVGVFERARTPVFSGAVHATTGIFWEVPPKVVRRVASFGNVEILGTDASGASARKNQRVSVRENEGTVVGGRGVDVLPQVLRSAPGSVEAGPLRNINIQAAGAAGPIRGKVKTETSL